MNRHQFSDLDGQDRSEHRSGADAVAGDEIRIGEIVAALLSHKWLIVALTALGLSVGVVVIYLSTPEYRADAIIQVEEGGRGISALTSLQPLLDDTTTVDAEMEIIRSRMILGRVVERLRLEVRAEPAYFPLLGRAVARRHAGGEVADPLLGFASYGWGGERIRVESLSVADHLIGEQLTLTALEDGHFEVSWGDEMLIERARVGAAVELPAITLFVSELLARPGTRFQLSRVSREEAVASLRAGLSVGERTRKSGVLGLSLVGQDRAQIAEVLDEILNTYVRQNVERRSAEAENTLKFLESQLPALKSQLDAAEAAYNNYRQSRGSVDLTLETQSVLRSVVDVDNEIVKLQQQREELRQSYTPQHPRVVALDAQIQRLGGRRSSLEESVAKLPDTQQTALRLRRDVEVTNALYMSLLNTAQQLRVSKAGTVGDVRIIDSALSARDPIKPRKAMILAAAAAAGLLLALGLIWLYRLMRVVVETPERIEQALGLPVYATIPHSKTEVGLTRRLKESRAARGKGVLAMVEPEDDAIESLRSLRTTLHFALFDAAGTGGSTHGSIQITGPSPGVGKSFISRNLASVLAQAGRKVVLIDGDLRKGHLHKEFGLPREGGLSEFISGVQDLDSVVRPTCIDGVSLITTGVLPPNPSELLMHPRFKGLLDALGQRFEIVLIDGSPILAVSDSAIIGRHTTATLLVARAGMHPVGELDQAVRRLAQAGVAVKGFVFNDFDPRLQRYRYGYGGYVYRYKY
ncbi:MAG: polysaccharide biosynthesis tyrosine autokinase [Rhodocyclaceae bacterium]